MRLQDAWVITMEVDQRLDAVDQRLQLIEERLSRLENAPLPRAAAPQHHVDADSPESVGGEGTPFLALAGKSILILGGAFLLRAATESTALPRQTGIALGLLYAVAWIVAAARAARAGRRPAAIFQAAVAAIVAYPIVWEATTRFGVFSSGAAALLLVGLSVSLLVVAHLHSLQSLAWIAAAGATMDALLLAFATKELFPFLIELTFVGVVALILSMSYVGWLLAVESDLFALVLIVLTVVDPSKDSRFAAVTALMLFVLLWTTMISRCSEQVAAASLIGIAGGSALVLSPSATAILWGCAAVVAAEIGRRGRSPAFALQSVTWGILASIMGGLFSFAAATLVESKEVAAGIPVPALIVTALCLVAFLRLDFARLPLLAVATCGLAAIMIHGALAALGSEAAATHALVRTVILAATAVVLALIGRSWNMREASQLAAALLLITGLKLVAQELRTGSAAILFIAFAVYGSAMLAIARLRRAPATS
jgi:hypothetical protein